MSPLIHQLRKQLPADSVITDQLRLLAYGTDASFYRLIPEVITIIQSESDMQQVLTIACQHGKPVTIRAAGTSLSGQAISNGVLALIGEGFATCEIASDAKTVKTGPGMVGGRVNQLLKPYGKKIGPDPASINSCKIGGIAANNASGMCCGISQNSYQTLVSIRVMLADGGVLDTGDSKNIEDFKVTHPYLLQQLSQLASQTKANQRLVERIRHKYKIKNTTGYSINALVDFDDPIDILSHLMIGSEGTLGFISNITYRTVNEDPYKASALLFFPDIKSACDAVVQLKPLAISAVELLDRASLRSVEKTPHLPPIITQLDEAAAALLIEVRGENEAMLDQRIETALHAIQGIPTLETSHFSKDEKICETYWKVRKGTFPSVGAMRKKGTTVIIEDVAFPIASLASATLDLQKLFKEFAYDEAIIFGHALEGNLHFVFTQDFNSESEVQRYQQFMDSVAKLVVEKYDGSLKSEHGTGRNMAPFVELEWGYEAAQLMRQIKKLFDPKNLLNPGVIINDDLEAHIKNLKPMPAADDLIDRCIECGFCETLCPSHGFTLSARQRIVGWREISRRKATGEDHKALEQQYQYMGLDTCAGCSLCSSTCPVDINTGSLVRHLRAQKQGPLAHYIGGLTDQHFSTVATASRFGIRAGHLLESVVGENALNTISGGTWRKAMPQATRLNAISKSASGRGDPVVYFPTCGGRIFGGNTKDQKSLPEVMIILLERAGYAPLLPKNFDRLCCGQALESRGLKQEANASADKLKTALLLASKNGRYPIVLDASPCSTRMKKHMGNIVKVLDFPDFAHDALLPRLVITKKQDPIALHLNCSARLQGSGDNLSKVAATCAHQVIQPSQVSCCGFGGDRGFMTPELNIHALRHVHEEVVGCCEGYSTNRTCEIGLTSETGISYNSIAYLLEECSRPIEGFC